MKAIVIGAGIGGLSAAAYLAKSGIKVTVLEKNSWVGGRVEEWKHRGLRFDCNPACYLIPEELDAWFEDLGFNRKSYFEIKRLDPAYKIIYDFESIEVPGNVQGLIELFEKIEPGAGSRLKYFLSDLAREYRQLLNAITRANPRKKAGQISVAQRILKFQRLSALLKNYHEQTRKVVYDRRLQKILGRPSLFSGETAESLPASYAAFNHVDFNLGNWYPEGGFSQITRAMAEVCGTLGVKIHCNEEAQSVEIRNRSISHVHSLRKSYEADVVLANADRHFVDQFLLPLEFREMNEKKWSSVSLSPTVFRVFLGLRDPLENFAYQTFFFDSDWDAHLEAMYTTKAWPNKPLFYVHCPGKADPDATTKNIQPALAMLPLASGVVDSPIERNKALMSIMTRMQNLFTANLPDLISFSKIEGPNDCEVKFNAYKGNVFGPLTAPADIARHKISNRSRKIKNLYFSGAGSGITMATVSGHLAATRILEEMLLNR